MFSINCPSCGNPVVFKLESSLYSTCEYCQTVLMRQNMNVLNIGKASCVQADSSPLKIGTTGTYKGMSFEILGRTQAVQSDGYWNEWFVAFSDGHTGWLSESIGEYCLTVEDTIEEYPDFNNTNIGSIFNYKGTSYIIANKGRAQVTAFEGELNFDPQGSYDLYYIDLRSFSGKAGTIDYSDFASGKGNPEIFIGEYLDFKDFNFQNLRDEEEMVRRRAETARSFKCPSCGASHELKSGKIARSYVCEYCGSCSDLSNDSVKLLFKYETDMAKNAMRIPLGTEAVFEGVTWTVIGAQQKYSKDDGAKEYWEEYLLYNDLQGYRYLEYNDDSWSLNYIIHNVPYVRSGIQRHFVAPANKDGSICYENITYKHYSSYVGYVEKVIGEFPYLIVKNETSHMTDYIAPPYGLCSELNSEGIFWSKSVYISPEQMAEAFNDPSYNRASRKIGLLEPSRVQGKLYNSLIHFVAVSALMLVFVLLALCRSSEIANFETKVYTNQDSSFVSEEFEVPGNFGNLSLTYKFYCQPPVWVEYNTTLVNVKTNEARSFEAVGDYWREGTEEGGNNPVSIFIPGVSGGKYRLRITPRIGFGNDEVGQIVTKEKPINTFYRNYGAGTAFLSYNVTVNRNVPFWKFWLILEFILAIVPAWYGIRYFSENTERWSNSDHCGDDDD